MKHIQKKICLLGDFAVGKTSLIRRFVEGRFDDRYLSSIGVKITRKTLERPDYTLNMLIWDLAGGDDFNDTRSGYLRGASGAMFVCDLTRADTLNVFVKYVTQLREISPDAGIVLLANKADLHDSRVIETKTLQAISEEFGVPFLLTSAKTGENVENAFSLLVEVLVKS
ncbi:MAG TPA: Rab family GTPase [Anaerolineales bacterium]|nr:Rab family GTPase [Anaerolineales bacterium]